MMRRLTIGALVLLTLVPMGYANNWFSLDCVNPDRVHCPCHAYHCYGIGPLTIGSEVTGTFAMLDNVGHPLAYPPSTIDLGENATLVVNLSLTNATPFVKYTVTVGVAKTLGIEWHGSTNQSTNMSHANNTTSLSFGFRMFDTWADGDYIFPEVALGGSGNWTTGYFAIEANDPSQAPVVPPTPTPTTPPATSTPPTLSTPATSTPSNPVPHGWLLVPSALAIAALATGRRGR